MDYFSHPKKFENFNFAYHPISTWHQFSSSLKLKPSNINIICTLIIRVLPRFFEQVGHETVNASSYDKYWTRRPTFILKIWLKILYFLKLCPSFVGSNHDKILKKTYVNSTYIIWKWYRNLVCYFKRIPVFLAKLQTGS